MTDGARTSPLARLGLAAEASDDAAPVRLGWARPAGMAIVRGTPPPGLDVPQEPNTTSGDDPLALWLGPDEWLLVGDVDADALGAVDVGHARAVLTLAGNRAVETLESLCPLDLARMPVGGCAQSRFGRLSVLLHRRAEARFDLYVGRSYAVAAWRLLVDAAAPYGHAVAGLDQSARSSE